MSEYIGMTDEEWAEQEARAEHQSDLKKELSDQINGDWRLGTAYPYMLEGDILYEGPLRPLLDFFQENSSEIEELGA